MSLLLLIAVATTAAQESRILHIKVTVTDAEIDSNLKQMQSQFPNQAEFTKALAARGMTLERLRADARVDLSINRMVEAEVASTPAPEDAISSISSKLTRRSWRASGTSRGSAV